MVRVEEISSCSFCPMVDGGRGPTGDLDCYFLDTALGSSQCTVLDMKEGVPSVQKTTTYVVWFIRLLLKITTCKWNQRVSGKWLHLSQGCCCILLYGSGSQKDILITGFQESGLAECRLRMQRHQTTTQNSHPITYSNSPEEVESTPPKHVGSMFRKRYSFFSPRMIL